MSDSTEHSHRRVILSGGLLLLVLLAAAVWAFWPQRVELSDDTYDVAIALYRVCNQRDAEGLARLEERLDELRSASGENDATIKHLQQMMNQARDGNWEPAMRSARQALDDQSNPH